MTVDDFTMFWQAYPKKVAKGDARKAWSQMSRMMPPIESILTAISAARETDQWRRDGGAYIPYPATWLRQERWDDVFEVEIDNPIVKTDAWWTTDEKTMEHGRKIGVAPRAGESMNDYKQRMKAYA